jgi:hypothetical protein
VVTASLQKSSSGVWLLGHTWTLLRVQSKVTPLLHSSSVLPCRELPSARVTHSEAHVIASADGMHIGYGAAESVLTTLIQQAQQRGLQSSLLKCTAFPEPHLRPTLLLPPSPSIMLLREVLQWALPSALQSMSQPSCMIKPTKP